MVHIRSPVCYEANIKLTLEQERLYHVYVQIVAILYTSLEIRFCLIIYNFTKVLTIYIP